MKSKRIQIKTKFGLRASVWTLHENKLVNAIVARVQVVCADDTNDPEEDWTPRSKSITYQSSETYSLVTKDQRYLERESWQIFSSKPALIKSLLTD